MYFFSQTNAEASKMLIKMKIPVFQAALVGACCRFWQRCSYSFRK